MDDDAICSLLGVLPPHHVTRIERTRHLLVVARHPDVFLRQAVLVADDWIRLVWDDVQQMVVVCAWDWQTPPVIDMHCFEFVQAIAKAFRGLMRAYAKQILAEAAESRALHVRKGNALATLEKLGGVQLKLQALQEELPFTCEYCPARFSKKSAKAVHMSAMHGMKALTHCAGGSTCQVCGVQWWTTARLRSHLERSEVCRLVYSNADLGTPRPDEIVGKRSDKAWRVPTPVQGPAPSWTLFRPLEPPPEASPVRDDGVQTLQDLLRNAGVGEFENWLKQALRWILKFGSSMGDIGHFVQLYPHPWCDCFPVLQIMQQGQFCSDGEQHGCAFARGDGHNIWLCVL